MRELIQPEIDSETRVFVFGSSLTKTKFRDVDLGFVGTDDKTVWKVQEKLEESTFPYLVDCLNFDTVNKKFQEAIENQQKLWLI